MVAEQERGRDRKIARCADRSWRTRPTAEAKPKEQCKKQNRCSAAGHRGTLRVEAQMTEADEHGGVEGAGSCLPSIGIYAGEDGVRPSSAVLVVSSIRQDREALRRILGRTHRTYAVSSYGEAAERLSRGGIAVVLWDCDLPDGTWVDLLTLLAESPDAPLLIVASRLADERLWAEVLHRGGFDVIAKPFEPREVEHVLRTAWLCRREPGRTRHSAGGA